MALSETLNLDNGHVVGIETRDVARNFAVVIGDDVITSHADAGTMQSANTEWPDCAGR